MKSVCKLALLIAFTTLVQGTAKAELPTRRTFTRTIEEGFDIATDGTTYLSNKYGEVQVKTWDRNRVKITVDIVVDASSEERANAIFNRIHINFANAADFVRATTEIESTRTSWWSWNSGSSKGDFRINYEVYLPAQNQLELTLKYGDAYLSQLEGPAKLDLKYGNFTSEGVGDRSTINLAYGNGTIVQAQNLNVNLAYGKLAIQKAGDIQLTSKYAKVEIEKAEDVDCETKYDTYQIMEIADFSNYGKYDNFSIRKARNIDLRGKYTSLEADEVQENVVLHTEYGSASLGMSPYFRKVDLDGRYTDFKVSVPAATSYQLDASGNYSSINYPDYLQLTREISASNSREIVGYQGQENTAALIKARMSYGGIRIRTR